MTTDSGKKPREIEIHFNSDGMVGAITQPDGVTYEPIIGKTILFREVTPCSNCERLEGDCKIISERLRESEDWELKHGEAIQRLKKQLEMCREYVEKINMQRMSMHKDMESLATRCLELSGELLAKLEKE